MPERTSYAQGTPNWVDLQTTDQDAAKAFYAGLFGWTYDDQPMAEGPVYSMAMLGGHQVAAIAPQPPEMAAAGAPPMWNTYIAVDSVDDAAAKVEAAGGKVAMAPFDVMDAGRMAFVMDPGGAAVALWQANQHIGATLVNEPGAVTWNELITADPSARRSTPAGGRHDHLHHGHGRGPEVHRVRGGRRDGGRHHAAADAGRAQPLARVLRHRRRGRHGGQGHRAGRLGRWCRRSTPRSGRIAVLRTRRARCSAS